MNFETIPATNKDLDLFLSNIISSSKLNEIKTKARIIKNFDINNIIFIGCYKKVNDDNVINGYDLYLPEITNMQTLLINIHEIMHALVVEKNIGNPNTSDIYEECLPIAMERLYILNYRKDLITLFNDYQQKLISNLKEEQDQKYFVAFDKQFLLCNLYKDNISLMLDHDFNLENNIKNKKILVKL